MLFVKLKWNTTPPTQSSRVIHKEAEDVADSAVASAPAGDAKEENENVTAASSKKVAREIILFMTFRFLRLVLNGRKAQGEDI
jgi:hypothetical protein